VRRIVEEHEPRVHGAAEVEHIQTRRRLIETVAISARVESEETAEEKADRRLVRDDDHALFAMTHHDLANRRKRTRQHRDAGLAAFRRERERILFPRDVLRFELLLDLAALQSFPAAVTDLAQAVDRHRRELAVAGDQLGRLDRA